MREVHGECHCGSVAYVATVDPAAVTICHCTDCQVLTGTACRVSVPAAADTVRLVRGTPKRYLKRGDSGALRVLGFCGDCGTPLYSHADDTEAPPAVWGLRVGAMRERAELPPTRRKWCRSALAWSLDVSGLPGQPAE